MYPLIKELREMRKKKNLTQAELARKVGLPQSHLSSIECGKIDLRVSTLVQLARVLECEPVLVPLRFHALVTGLIAGRENVLNEPRFLPDVEED